MDKYHVYRPLLDLTGFTEGTDKGDGYNETLGYGIMLDGRVSKGKGTDVVLTAMTLDQVDKLQTRMLKDPDNRWNSSAIGRFQIVRTTLRSIKETLGLSGSELFDAEMQDRMACFLLGQRGIDKYLAGRLSEDTMLLNLAKEWASLPTPEGKGFYGGQHAAVKPDKVRAVLAEVRRRHRAGQPANIPAEVEEKVEEKAKEKTGLWQKVTGALGFGGTAGGFLWGMEWQTLAVLAGATILILLLILVLRRQIVGAVKDIREGLA